MAPTPIRALATVYIFTSMLAQWVIVWIVQVLFMAVTYAFMPMDRIHNSCGFIFRVISWIGMDILNPFWRAHKLNSWPTVAPRADGSKSRVILMMNHLSDADPFVSLHASLPHEGSWIAKDELFRVPFGGWAMGNADDLKVVFKDKKKGLETVKGTVRPLMEAAARKLRSGRMICVFPEGTRNPHPQGPVQPFKLGFFSLAIEEDAVIVPLAISGTDRMWPRGRGLFDVADAYFSFGDAVKASDFASAQELSDKVWSVITELREKHPDRVALRAAQADAKSTASAAEGKKSE